MKSFKQRLTSSMMALALLGSMAALAAPATHAAPAPYLTITALHGSTYVYGWDFVNNQQVTLRAYGLANGQKVLLGTTQVVSVAPVPYTLDFQWDFAQAQDPCTGSGGYLRLEVDAYNTITRRLASARTASSISLPPTVFSAIATATADVQCGTIIY